MNRRSSIGPLALAFGLVLIFSVQVGFSAGAEDDPAQLDPMEEGLELRERLDRLVERVKSSQGDVSTMKAQFFQEQASQLLVDTESRSGTFFYRAKPEAIRWQYSSPKPVIMVMDSEVLTTYYPDLNRASKQTIKRYSERVFKYLGASGSLETMTRYFWLTARFPSAEGQPYRIDLKPRFSRVAKRVKGMELWIDPELFLPIYMKYVEPNGDYTEYRFEDLEVNPEIDSKQFGLELPADVEIE